MQVTLKFFFSFFFLTLIGLPAVSQDVKKEKTDHKAAIEKTFLEFFDATKEKDVVRIVDYMYPKLFELVPKDILIQTMEESMEKELGGITFYEEKIDSISAEIIIDDSRFAVIDYRFFMSMDVEQYKPEEAGDSTNLIDVIEFTMEMLKLTHGEENVNLDETGSKIDINVITKAFAIQSNTDPSWKFIEYKPESLDFMKQILPKEALELAAKKASSCIECCSLKDAFANPIKVRSLIINAEIHGENIDSLSSSIGDFTNLEILYLTDHSFNSIPKEIGLLQNLKQLSFAGCNLTEVPDEIFELKNLEELLLYDNKFSKEYVKKFKKMCRKLMPKTQVEIDY